MKYLFGHLREFEKVFGFEYLTLFLDYDGTLLSIRKDFRKAILPVKDKKFLRHLTEANDIKLAIVSGRSLRDIKKTVGLPGMIYVGNHGLEIEGRGIRFKYRISNKFKACLKKAKYGLTKNLSGIHGVFMEDKVLTFNVHYRRVDPADVPLVKMIFKRTIAPYIGKRGLRIVEGKKTFEVRPSVKWDKGKAVLWILSRRHIFIKRPFPVYVGDDETDEDAFLAIRRKGISVVVGRKSSSNAKFYLKDPADVHAFLKYILRLRKKQGSGEKPNAGISKATKSA